MVVIPDELKSILESTPDTINGNVRFQGTRIQARILFDYVLSGEGLDEFLADFPDVKKEDALALLDWEHRNVTLKLESAA